MKVKLNQNIKYLYKGKIQLPGNIFDFEGTKPEFLTIVSGAEAKKAEEFEKRTAVVRETQCIREAFVESEEPDIKEIAEQIKQESKTGSLIDDVDFGNLSPDEIKAKIKEFEAQETQETPVKQKPVFTLIKKPRGWFDVKNPKGKKITHKKIRREEAIKLIESFNGTFEEK